MLCLLRVFSFWSLRKEHELATQAPQILKITELHPWMKWVRHHNSHILQAYLEGHCSQCAGSNFVFARQFMLFCVFFGESLRNEKDSRGARLIAPYSIIVNVESPTQTTLFMSFADGISSSHNLSNI